MISKTDTVYISGPMTGLPSLNYPAFNETEKWLKQEFGCSVLNPARQPDGMTYQEYMRLAYADLDQASAVFFLRGWKKSRGAKNEYARACRHDKRRFFQGKLRIEKERVRSHKGRSFICLNCGELFSGDHFFCDECKKKLNTMDKSGKLLASIYNKKMPLKLRMFQEGIKKKP